MNTLRTLAGLLTAAAGLALLTACAGGMQPDSRSMQADQDDITQLHAQYLRAFNGKDAAGVAATYTDDAVLMPPNTPAVKTSLAIQDFTRQEFSQPIGGLLLNVVDTQISGNYAFSSGYYTLLNANGGNLDRGKFLEVMRKDGQSWKFYRDMYNSDNPAPGTAVPAAGTVAAPAAATH